MAGMDKSILIYVDSNKGSKMEKFKLSVLEKVGFGSGDMAVNVVISSMMLIITYFYTDIYGLKPSDLAALFIVVRLIDAVTDPLMGIINDKVNTRWGRYRPYFFVLAIPFGISVFLTFSTPDWSYNLKLVYAYATYILVTVIFTSVTIPYISLISVLTNDPQERLSANGYRLFLAKIAAFLVTIIVPQLSATWGKGNMQLGYQISMGLMGLMATVLFFFCFFTTKERLEHTPSSISLWKQAGALIKNDQWLWLCGACLTGTIGYVIRGSVGAYYAKYYLGGGPVMISNFLATGVTASILAMVCSTWITKHYCKIKLFRYSQVVVTLLSILMFFIVGRNDIALAFIMYFIISLVVDLQAPIFWSAIAEAVDYGKIKNGDRASGLSFGGISFCQKLGMGVAGAIVGWLLTYFNYVPDKEQTEFTLTGIALMLSIIPGLFHLLMGLAMFKYKITDSYYEKMLENEALANAVKDEALEELHDDHRSAY